MIQQIRNLNPQQRLGLLRIAFFGLFLYLVKFNYLTEFLNLKFDLRCSSNMGIWFFWEISDANFIVLKWICIAAAITSCLGLLTRLSYFTLFASFLILNMYALKFCYWNHLYMPLHIPIFLWALLDRHSSYRLDDFIFKRNQVSSDIAASDINFFIKVNRIFFCIVFFSTGWAKLNEGGVNWVFSDSLRHMLNVQNFANANTILFDFFQSINHWLMEYPSLCMLLALDTILIELLTPIALFSVRASRLVILHLVLMQIGITVVMYINFSSWYIIYLFWLPLFPGVEPTLKWPAKVNLWKILQTKKN